MEAASDRLSGLRARGSGAARIPCRQANKLTVPHPFEIVVVKLFSQEPFQPFSLFLVRDGFGKVHELFGVTCEIEQL